MVIDADLGYVAACDSCAARAQCDVRLCIYKPTMSINNSLIRYWRLSRAKSFLRV